METNKRQGIIHCHFCGREVDKEKYHKNVMLCNSCINVSKKRKSIARDIRETSKPTPLIEAFYDEEIRG